MSNRILLSLYLSLAYVFIGYWIGGLQCFINRGADEYFKEIIIFLFFPPIFLTWFSSGIGLFILAMIMWGIFYFIIYWFWTAKPKK